MGLFAGASLISIVEAGFWMLQVCSDYEVEQI